MKANNVRKRAFIYLRVSTMEQEVKEQYRICVKHCEDNDIEVIGLYGDYGARDKAKLRQNFQAMLSDVQVQRPDLIIVERLDRFGTQDSNELGHFLYTLKEKKVRLITAIDGMDRSRVNLETTIQNCFAAGTSITEQIARADRTLKGKRGKAELGQYVGGKVLAFGLDLVCLSKDGSERWRMVEESRDLRIKYILANGEYIEADRYGMEVVSSYDGIPDGIMPKRTVYYRPVKEKGDELYLRPSIRKERLELVRRIFSMFVDDGMTTFGIAETLNSQGVKPLYTDCWYSALIDSILDNPVYIGQPAFNRSTKNRFKVIQDGDIKTANEDLRYRTTQQVKTDWIMPDEPIFDPIVNPETFHKAQEMLFDRKNGTPKRKPKDGSLWFGGLWVDKDTGRKLGGSSLTKDLRVKAFGHTSKRISFKQAEDLIRWYLEETGQRLEIVKEAVETNKVMQRLETEQFMKDLEIEFISLELQQYLSNKLKQGYNDVGGLSIVLDKDDEGNQVITSDVDLLDIYCQMIADDSKKNKEYLQLLAIDRERLEKEYISAIRKGNDYLKDILEVEISKVNSLIKANSEQVDYRNWCKQVAKEIEVIQANMDRVRQSLASEPIAKAKAIREIIDMVELEWMQTPTNDKRYQGFKTTLAKATFHPTNGGAAKVMTVETSWA